MTITTARRTGAIILVASLLAAATPAAAASDRDAALYGVAGDRQKSAATLLKLGIVHHRRHQHDAAVVSAERALVHLDADSEAWLRAYVHFNLALFLFGRGDLDRAEEELEVHETLINAADESLAFRAGWLNARIAWRREDVARAERLFRESRAVAVELKLRYEAGLICLELALAHLVQGGTSAAQDLASDALRLFAEEEQVEQETRAALELVEEATRREALTRELVERAVTSLERGRYRCAPT